MLILSFDPSISCTGWAVIRDDGSDHGALIQAGTIKPRDGDPKEKRIALIYREARDLLDEIEPQVVVAELPSTHGHNRTSDAGRFQAGQPIYGAAVGAVIGAACCTVNEAKVLRITPPRLLCYGADEWTRRIPGTRNDPHKTQRVALAARLYGRSPEDLGAKTVAGNVADAVLLGRHGLIQMQSEKMATVFRAGA